MPIRVPIADPVKPMSMEVGTPRQIDIGSSAIFEEFGKMGEPAYKYIYDMAVKKKEAEDRNFVDNRMGEYAIQRAQLQNDLQRKMKGTDGKDYYSTIYKWDKKFREESHELAPSGTAAELFQHAAKMESTSTRVNAEVEQNNIFNTYVTEKPGLYADDTMSRIAEMPQKSYYDFGTTSYNNFLSALDTAVTKGIMSPEAAQKVRIAKGNGIAMQVGEYAIRTTDFETATKLVGSPWLWNTIVKQQKEKAIAEGDTETAHSLQRLQDKYGPLMYGDPLRKDSPMAGALKGNDKEKIIRAMLASFKTKEKVDKDELNRKLGNFKDASLSKTHDYPTMKSTAESLITEVEKHPTKGNVEKLDDITGIRYGLLYFQATDIIANMSAEAGDRLVEDMNKINFKTGEVPPSIASAATEFGLDTTLFGILRDHPEIGTSKHTEFSKALKNWHEKFRSELDNNSANTISKYNKNSANSWGDTINIGPSPMEYVAQKGSIAKAIAMSKMYGQTAGVAEKNMNYMPTQFLDRTLDNLNKMSTEGRYEDANLTLEVLKESMNEGLRTKSAAAQMRMWKDLGDRDTTDAWGPELGIVAQLPMSDRGELIRQQNPKNIEALEQNLGKDFPLPQFTNVIAENPQWSNFKTTMLATGSQDDAVFVANMEKILGRALANKFILNKSKATSVEIDKMKDMDAKKFAMFQAGEAQQIIDKYVNKHWTSVVTGASSIRASNEMLNLLSTKLTPEAKHKYDNNPSIRKNMIEATDVVARRSAMADPGFVVPPEIEAQYIKMDEELKKTYTLYDRRFSTPQGRRYEYIMNAHLVTDDNGGIKFMYNDKAHPNYDFNPDGSKTPSQKNYMIQWDSVAADPDFSEGIMKASNKEDWWKWMYRDRAYALELMTKSKKRQKEHKANVDKKAQEKLKQDIKERNEALGD